MFHLTPLIKTRIKDNKSELFIEGDNQSRSIDSRRFGWITDDYLIGKVSFVWFSFKNYKRYIIAKKKPSEI